MRSNPGRKPLPAQAKSSQLMESLEGRTLLSGATASTAMPLIHAAVLPISVTTRPAPTPTPTGCVPMTIHPAAGTPFSGNVGAIKGLSPSLAPRLTASIKWGDASAPTAGRISFDAAGLLHVSGAHTYAAAGTFPVTVSVIQNPPPGSMIASRLYRINSVAQVSGQTQTAGGVTIHPTAGKPFSGDVGTLQGLFPSSTFILTASINWGDSTTPTAGQISFDAAGLLHVSGTHTYAAAGTFPITVSVVQNPPPGSMAPSRLFRIDSVAQVSPAAVGAPVPAPVPLPIPMPMPGTPATSLLTQWRMLQA